jgi:DUF4097 and DUF4098 domain-containing protein YvlB
LIPLGVIVAAGPPSVEKDFDTTPSPRISVSNLVGHVTVTGWDKSQVHVTSTSASPQVEVDMDQLPATGRAEKIDLTARALSPQLTHQDQNTDFALEAPTGSSLEIRNAEGSVRIAKIHGATSVESVGGTIVVIDSGSHLWVRSIGGDVEVVRPAERVEASSVNGSLRFVSPTSLQLRASTTSGKIFYEGDFFPGGDYHFSDYNGDMEIVTPPSASFELKAKTVRGKVVADPELAVTPRKRSFSPLYGASSLVGTHNTGAATVDLTSFSGTIRIRRLQ